LDGGGAGCATAQLPKLLDMKAFEHSGVARVKGAGKQRAARAGGSTPPPLEAVAPERSSSSGGAEPELWETLCRSSTAPVSLLPSFPGSGEAPSAPAGPDAPQEEKSADEDRKAEIEAARRRRLRALRTVPANFLEGTSYNGFKTAPEIHAFECSEASLAPYSLPAEALTHVPDSQDIIATFRNGDRERKIHNNVPLSKTEIDQLAAMRREAKARGLSFYPTVTSMATRFLSRARMDPLKAVKFMKETQDWREQFFKRGPVSDEQVRQDMRYGIVYFTGRDSALRPTIVVRAARIPQQWYKDRCIDRFIRMLIFCMEYFLRYMVVPGKVENLSVIVDLQGLGLPQVPLGPLGEVYKVMSHHYIGRVYKFYVCNMSTTLSAIAGMAKGFLTDRQKQKVNILDDVKHLRREFALHQLETDLGGTRPKVSQFLPFQLNPGPYTAGYDGEPDATAVSEVHHVLSMAGAIGRLWDPKCSAEQNTRLEYGPQASRILRACNLPIPPELRFDLETPLSVVTGRCFPRESSDEAEAPLEPPNQTFEEGSWTSPSSRGELAQTLSTHSSRGGLVQTLSTRDDEYGDTELDDLNIEDVFATNTPRGTLRASLCSWCRL